MRAVLLKIFLVALMLGAGEAMKGKKKKGGGPHGPHGSKHGALHGSKHGALHGSKHGPKHGRHAPHYGPSHGSHYGGGYYGYPPPPPPPPPAPKKKPLTVIDKLYERINDVTDQIKTAGEIMDGLDSRLSLVTKAAAEFRTVTVIDVFSKNNAQNGELERINHTLSELMTETMELEMAVNTADVQNEANTNAIHDAEKTWAELKKNDTMQDGNLGILHVAVKDFKEKLLAVLANEFAFLDHHVEYAQFKLDTVKAKENARMCEVGSVTLTSEDRRAEYVFQSNFRTVPQIFYSITGFSKNLDAREDPKPHPPAASHYGYGYAPPPKPKEPNSLGVLVLVNPSQKALTVESFAGDFGDTEGISVDVTFQACTIGSGTNITDVHNFNLTTTTASTTDEMTSTTTATEFD